MISVYCLDISKISEEQYPIFYAAASKVRQEKAERCRFLPDKIRCVISDLLLQYSVKKWFYAKKEKPEGIKRSLDDNLSTSNMDSFFKELPIVIGENGKPYLKNVPDFFYNLSHSGAWVVLACANHEVGADVERLRPDTKLERMTRRFFTEQECDYIFNGVSDQEKLERFTKVWTCKESYVKYLGIGLAKGLNTFSVDVEQGHILENSCIQEMGSIQENGCSLVCGEQKQEVMVYSEKLGTEYYVSVCAEKDEVQYCFLTAEQLQM